MIRAVLDADVLYPLPLRDTLLSAAHEGCFQPAWSAEILDEAIRNLLADGRLTPEGAATLRRSLDTAFEDALVHDHGQLIAQMRNHPKDRHVAACAAAAKAAVIVTSNTKDFVPLPAGIAAMTPDDFLLLLMGRSRERLVRALAAQSARLVRKPMDVPAILDLLRPVAPKFVDAWRGA
jgi:hypothetical protein